MNLVKQREQEQGSLMTNTQVLLRKKDLLVIYKETGISYHWLRKFVDGQFSNPSVNRVQILYEHLTGNKLL